MDQIQKTDTCPEIITGGQENRMKPEEVRKKRLENQLELLSLSKNSKHIITDKSGHFQQLSEPAIVIDVIKDCAEAININKPSPINAKLFVRALLLMLTFS